MLIGPVIPGLGVKYTSPANIQTQNALNIRSTGATAGEANRFANLAPAGTTTKPAKLTPQDTMDIITGRATVPPNAQGPLRGGYVTGSQAANTATNTLANKVAAQTGVTATGSVVSVPPPTGGGAGGAGGTDGRTGGAGGAGGAGGGGGGGGTGGGAGGGGGDGAGTGGGSTSDGAGSTVDVQALYDSILAGLLEADWLGFQGDRAAELRRLQNLRNQLYGDPEFGTTGSLQRQRDLDAQARRRLAAGRAVAGMLQGGAYAGGERGLGTLQQTQQELDVQEMLRPFREQTASDRLAEFGLLFDPTSRIFDLSTFGNEGDMMSGWAASTWAGREAAARARQAALQQLAQRGLSLD